MSEEFSYEDAIRDLMVIKDEKAQIEKREKELREKLLKFMRENEHEDLVVDNFRASFIRKESVPITKKSLAAAYGDLEVAKFEKELRELGMVKTSESLRVAPMTAKELAQREETRRIEEKKKETA